jgi:O-antigen ligase
MAAPTLPLYFWTADDFAASPQRSDQAPAKAAEWSFRRAPTELKIIVAFVIVTRIGYMPATKIGVQLGPMPLFLTDLTLLLLLAITLFKNPIKLLSWATAGTGAGMVGASVWLLWLLAFSYFAFAFGEYKIFAVRDLAIFGYSIFFPLTYFAVRSRTDAVAVCRAFIYSGLVLALILLAEVVTGVNTGFLNHSARLVFGKYVSFIGDDDVGAISTFSMVGLLAYTLLDERGKLLKLTGALLCMVALAATTTRSATLGAVLALGMTFLVADRGYKIAAGLLIAGLALIVIVANTHPQWVPFADLFQNFSAAMVSGSTGQQDPTALFRILRWRYVAAEWKAHPIFGVGFGTPIVAPDLVIPGETEGLFNVGMPHNTYLFLLARTGVLGLSLVAFGLLTTIIRVAARARQRRLADELAVANVLVAMGGFAGFVLFFERPLYNAPYWIMMAVATRLLLGGGGVDRETAASMS